MKKNVKTRGRPILIKPWMDALIAARVIAEKQKPPEEQAERKILADEIQREIKSRIQERIKNGIQKEGDERVSALATLEKRITFHRKQNSPEDKPWTIFTLNQHPISPEVLPRVLEEYRRIKLIAEQLGDEEVAAVPYLFTIRHAKWLARLSILKSPEALGLYYRILANAEQLSELTGHPPDYGLFEEALAALEANDIEREAAVMAHYIDWSTFELARLLGPQGQKFVERFREIEEKKLRKLREEEEHE